MSKAFIPYGRQSISEEDIAAVVEVLRSDWLTCGPTVERFEEAFTAKVGARFAVAVNSGTAALHAALFALGIGPGDEVIVPPITFAATANAAVFMGARLAFADVDAATLLIDPAAAERCISPKTRAILSVDYAGLSCDYVALSAVAERHGVHLVADACHALGGNRGGRAVGSLAELNTFSFHPVKHIAAGEGGMITTDREDLAERMRDFRTHGITRDPKRFRGLGDGTGNEFGPWYYEMQELGYNYRLSDIACALGLSQLGRLDAFVARRRAVAARYREAFRGLSPVLRPLATEAMEREHAFHLYVVRIDFQRLGKTRTRVMEELRARGIGTQVHYIPVHLQPFYREKFGCGPGLCPVAEKAYGQLLSLPMFAAMTDGDIDRVIAAVKEVVA